jgi:L-lactate dehydrogenase complex protein LldG
VFDELQNHGISSILSWEKNLLPHGLIDSLRSKGITVSEEFNEEVKAGLSGAQAAIAETGTLVLPSGKGRAQFVSLTPEIHFAVLRASDIFRNITQVLDLPEVRQASTTALISGPSRTADIEMTLTLGVHGPRKVHVFCLERE